MSEPVEMVLGLLNLGAILMIAAGVFVGAFNRSSYGNHNRDAGRQALWLILAGAGVLVLVSMVWR